MHEVVINATAAARAAALSEASVSKGGASAFASCQSAPLLAELPVETPVETDPPLTSQVDELPAVPSPQNEKSLPTEISDSAVKSDAASTVEITASAAADDIQNDASPAAKTVSEDFEKDDVSIDDSSLDNDTSPQPAATTAAVPEPSPDAAVVGSADVVRDAAPEVATADKVETIQPQPAVTNDEVKTPVTAGTSAKEKTNAPITIGTARKKNSAPISIGATTKKKKSAPISIGSTNKRKSAPIVFGSSHSKKADGAETAAPTNGIDVAGAKASEAPTPATDDSSKSKPSVDPQGENKATASSTVEAASTESSTTETKAEGITKAETGGKETEVAKLSTDEVTMVVEVSKMETEETASEVADPAKDAVPKPPSEATEVTATEATKLSAAAIGLAESPIKGSEVIPTEVVDSVEAKAEVETMDELNAGTVSTASTIVPETKPLDSTTPSELPEDLPPGINDENTSPPLSNEAGVFGLIENESADKSMATESAQSVEGKSTGDAAAAALEIETNYAEHSMVEKVGLPSAEDTVVEDAERDEAALDGSASEADENGQVQSKGTKQKWWNKIRNKKNNEKTQAPKEPEEIKPPEKRKDPDALDDVDWDAL